MNRIYFFSNRITNTILFNQLKKEFTKEEIEYKIKDFIIKLLPNIDPYKITYKQIFEVILRDDILQEEELLKNRKLIKNIINSEFDKIPEQQPKVKLKPEINLKVLRTEDTGKIFEMAICLVYGIKYDGKYKYSMEKAEILKNRLNKLTELFPTCYHTAKKGSRYDFTSANNENIHLSAKTTKRLGKIAPQVIGQSQPSKFCTLLNIKLIDIASLKEYIQKNITNILHLLVQYTFDCPNIYYNEYKDQIKYIKLFDNIDWSNYEYDWTCNWEKWSNSSTLKIKYKTKYIPLVEFQFHTKSRTNMAVRWFYENFLTVFKDKLEIINL